MIDAKTQEPDAEDPMGKIAREDFGIPYVFPWQRLVMANIVDAVEAACATTETEIEDDVTRDEDGALRGRQIVLLPTGAGKSLCFQAPALILPGPTLVIYPLLALMSDQTRRMAERGIAPAIFRGGQDREERERQLARLEGRDGLPPAKLVIANPEVLCANGDGDTGILARIAAMGVSHLAVDEAHCVADWGDSFRPSYLELGKIIDRLSPPAVTAFTATASPPVLERVSEVLFGGRAHVVRGASDRPNISYSVRRCVPKEPALLLEAAKRKRPLVVFCATRGGTERSAILLGSTFGMDKVRFYHAGLTREEKTAVEGWFHGNGDAILCATCAWGMGVDKKDVRTVIHRDAPPSVEAYAQEAGRAGRDGERAEAVLIWGPDDARRLTRLPDSQRSRAMALVELADGTRCRREVILEALGEPEGRSGDGERVACAGCDVCDGIATKGTGDEDLVLDYVDANRRCFERDEIANALCALGNEDSRERFGFVAWKRSDFTMIMGELERRNRIREIGYWPLKGKITVTSSSFSRAFSARLSTWAPLRSRALPHRSRPRFLFFARRARACAPLASSAPEGASDSTPRS